MQAVVRRKEKRTGQGEDDTDAQSDERWLFLWFPSPYQNRGIIAHKEMIASVIDSGAGDNGEDAADQKMVTGSLRAKREIRESQAGLLRRKKGGDYSICPAAHGGQVDQPAGPPVIPANTYSFLARVEDNGKGDRSDKGNAGLKSQLSKTDQEITEAYLLL